ncbi:uncharacterized protein N7458_012671 [Penicillium daleae]|uniref:Uncharacterized protein n=1 Tax=Penicillium daleae TaxID=63821 RepID=A0AAD6FYJ9_9EURO|nr:uncharacterized protein N7458_012671 [Penicillium daleae]KAJ5433515.1 hypothetical protein N7458_012671 [Penicillium daleae]
MTTEGSSLTTGLNLEGLVHALLSNNIELDKRLSAVEAKVMTIDLTKPGERSNAALIHENTAGDRQSDQAIPGRVRVVRTRDIKDLIIEEQQEWRERTHDAVEDVEVYVEGQLW